MYDNALIDRARSRPQSLIGGPTVIGHPSNQVCGDDIEVSARVVDGVIVAAAYRSHACAITMASASVLADRVRGQAIASVPGMRDALRLLPWDALTTALAARNA